MAHWLRREPRHAGGAPVRWCVPSGGIPRPACRPIAGAARSGGPARPETGPRRAPSGSIRSGPRIGPRRVPADDTAITVCFRPQTTSW